MGIYIYVQDRDMYIPIAVLCDGPENHGVGRLSM